MISVILGVRNAKGHTDESDNLDRCCLDIGSTWNPDDEEGLESEP